VSNMAPALSVPGMGTFAGFVNPAGQAGKAPWLCSDIQDTLVPPITYESARVEAHGQTIPMDDVGGDLVDLVADGENVIAYVADVSGHGLRAGVLMGMTKTAVRYGLMLGQPLAKLLDDINSVLPAVKQPNMFATLAALRFDCSNEVEYISAGHVPLLHYRKRNADVVRYSMSQFPLGLFARTGYASMRIPYEAGDIFALVTDGVVEIGEDQDADFGFERLAQILRDHSQRPLSDIVEAVQAEVNRHGAQQDDQTVLLVRAAGESDPMDHGIVPNWHLVPNWSDTRADGLQVCEARWQKVLDELAAHLASE
jgi:serine phosphatase RsbU (regulator of sigma subunit)